MKVDHIGFLCADIEKSIALFKSLGFEKQSQVYVDSEHLDGGGTTRNVYICFMQNGDEKIELVSPINEESDVFNTLKRQGEGPYHICLKVKSIEDQLDKLKKQGWIILKRPAKAIAFSHARVVFIFKKGAGLIELVENEGIG